MFQLVWCVLCTLYHLRRYDVLDSYPPISHVPIPALCAASKVLVIKSYAGQYLRLLSVWASWEHSKGTLQLICRPGKFKFSFFERINLPGLQMRCVFRCRLLK